MVCNYAFTVEFYGSREGQFRSIPHPAFRKVNFYNTVSVQL